MRGEETPKDVGCVARRSAKGVYCSVTKNSEGVLCVTLVYVASNHMSIYEREAAEMRMKVNEIKMRIIGLDYGSVTVGVAVSDSMLLTAQPIEVIKREKETKLRRTLARIDEIIAEYEVEKIVLGYPKNMNNTLGERVERTEEFKEKLEQRTGLEVVLWDERLTTVSAVEVLKEAKVRREDRKTYVDKMAAALILQGYLDFLRNQK